MTEHKLVTLGKEYFEEKKRNRGMVEFTKDKEADALLNDLKHFPHAFVLACVMDRQIAAERAWSIPCTIKNVIGAFDIDTLASLTEQKYQKIFDEHKLHRFNDKMASFFYGAVCRIKNVYVGDASKIWKGNPSSAKVVYEFLQFGGAGPKIATMAANILAREFHVPFSDYYSIDISTDVHVMRVFRRCGLIDKDADKNSAIYKARELCSEYPGIVDFPCWEIGREWCHEKNPDCNGCPLCGICKKQM